MPEPNATACGMPSSAASARSNRATVGFHSRAYTAEPPSGSRPPAASTS